MFLSAQLVMIFAAGAGTMNKNYEVMLHKWSFLAISLFITIVSYAVYLTIAGCRRGKPAFLLVIAAYSFQANFILCLIHFIPLLIIPMVLILLTTCTTGFDLKDAIDNKIMPKIPEWQDQQNLVVLTFMV